MDEKYFDQVQLESLKKYFKYLSQTGYMKMSNVKILLASIFLLDVLKDYQWYITEQDYKLIDSILRQYDCCSCLISYNSYKNIPIEPLKAYLINQPIKVTENIDIRTTQIGNLRLPDLL